MRMIRKAFDFFSISVFLDGPGCWTRLKISIPDGMNFDPVKCVKETFSRAGYAYRMNFDPPARRHICSGDSQITCLKWSLVHFQIAAKMNFAPLSYQWLHRKSKVDQSSFWRRFESGSNFILNTWSENSPIICYISQVDQSSFGLHILHVIRSPSHSLLDQNSYPRTAYMIKAIS